MAGYSYRLPRKYRYRGGSNNREMAIGVAIAAVVVLGATQHGKAVAVIHGHAAAGIPAVSAPVAHGGTLNCAGLEQLWVQAGGSPSTATLAASVAMAESGGQQSPPSNAGSNYNGMTDVGYWQINSGIFPSLATTDPIGNARAAIQISHDGTDWSPWVTYTTQAYVGKC